jgi:transcriptional regulator with XRE-family HTH domain
MIRGEAEYRDAVARSRGSADRLGAYREELRAQGFSADEVERAVGLAVDLLGDLNEEIRLYERIKSGDLSGFRALRDVGPLLIAARLARGLSQRDLAERLGVHESQVSRDEKTEYQSVSLERAAQILDVLAIDVEIRASPGPEGVVAVIDQPGGSDGLIPFQGPSERHGARAASPSS